MDRRQFLRVGLAGAAASQLGCLASADDELADDELEASSPLATSAQLDELEATLNGPVLRPGDSGFTSAKRLYNTRFDSTTPQAIAQCTSSADIAAAIKWARKYNVPIATRSGGHSYGGYSSGSGLVIDVKRMKQLYIDGSSGLATVSAGARLIDVYSGFAAEGLTLPAGTCPSVGIAGLTLGGGIGMLSRAHGLTCDNLVWVKMVLASGEIVYCDNTRLPDLFWACRGGGGGNFGVAASFRFRCPPARDVTVFTLRWSLSRARTIIDAWQRWAPSAPSSLFAVCSLLGGWRTSSTTKSSAAVRVYGQFLGSEAELRELLAPMLATSAGQPSSLSITTKNALDAALHFAGCEGRTPSQCHVRGDAADGQLSRETYKAKSDFIGSAWSSTAIDTLVSWVTKRQNDLRLEGGGVLLDPMGGMVNSVAKDASAFVHRDRLFLCQYLAPWVSTDSSEVSSANFAWINDFHAAMRPFVSGNSYQNYIDPALTSWASSYYGANYPRLQQLKAKYDPANVFRFAQSIRLPG